MSGTLGTKFLDVFFSRLRQTYIRFHFLKMFWQKISVYSSWEKSTLRYLVAIKDCRKLGPQLNSTSKFLNKISASIRSLSQKVKELFLRSVYADLIDKLSCKKVFSRRLDSEKMKKIVWGREGMIEIGHLDFLKYVWDGGEKSIQEGLILIIESKRFLDWKLVANLISKMITLILFKNIKANFWLLTDFFIWATNLSIFISFTYSLVYL